MPSRSDDHGEHSFKDESHHNPPSQIFANKQVIFAVVRPFSQVFTSEFEIPCSKFDIRFLRVSAREAGGLNRLRDARVVLVFKKVGPLP